MEAGPSFYPRSLLFVPADQPAKMEKAWASGADVLILDLEDSIAPSAKAAAREHAKAFLHACQNQTGPRLFVRINALDTRDIDADLDAVMHESPHGIVLPKSQTGKDVVHLSVKIAVREAENNLADGGTRILAIATETPQSVFGLGTYANMSQRLVGLTWGVEDLSAVVGSHQTRLASGDFTPPYALVRSLALLGAAAADVMAIDGIYGAFKDDAGLVRECEAALKDGFTGKLAIHPAQVTLINAAFTPSKEALAHAQAIVDAFSLHPDAGVIAFEGRMLDRPHLVKAQRLLGRI
jgi:citrate lyase subunit beta / citryl-CoA lyase